jgi:hypothetical protein
MAETLGQNPQGSFLRTSSEAAYQKSNKELTVAVTTRAIAR